MFIVLFVLTKFAVYCIFCGRAQKHFAFTEEDAISFGLRWGTARFFIGVAAGIPIAFIFAATQEIGLPVALSYMLSFIPARYVEWLLLFKLMARSKGALDIRANTWVMMGVGVSLALDLFAWTVIEFGNVNLKFFC